MRILVVSDVVEPLLYRASVARWLPRIDLLISCGDLPPDYLDFLASSLGVRLVHVVGNHCQAEHDMDGHCSPQTYLGALNLHGRAVSYDWGGHDCPRLLLGGMEGSPLYNYGPHQYTEPEAWMNLTHMVPGLLMNKLLTGRYLDILVTHAPPRGIHDLPDQAHRGFESLLSFIGRFKPSVVLHGHSHRYDPMLPVRTERNGTTIINTYGHALLELSWEGNCAGWRLAVPDQKKVAYG